MPTRDLASSWGARIRELRRERGLTLFRLAQLTGIEQGNLSRYERGLQVPGDQARISIAAAFGLQVADIFTYPDTREAS